MNKYKKILNMKIKDAIDYCNNYNCSECPLQSICIFRSSFNNQELTLISMLSYNVEKLKDQTLKQTKGEYK